MKPDKPHSPSEWDRSYKALACAVLTTAIKDAVKMDFKPKIKSSYSRSESIIRRGDKLTAIHFLKYDTVMFNFWCMVAGLNPRLARKRIKGMLLFPNAFRKRISRYENKPYSDFDKMLEGQEI